MNRFSQSVVGRGFAALLSILMLLWGACIPATPLTPYAGIPDFAKINLVAVPGGQVNTAGGNLIVSRVDMSIDTILGTQEIAAVYNSASGEWLWNFQISFDGTHFIDWTGYEYPDIPADGAFVGPDGSLPGVIWVRVDEDTMKTKGGLAYHFGTEGELAAISWATMDYPRIEFTPTQIAQCTRAASCTAIYTLSLNANGDPLTVTDARTGRTAEFSYDTQGRLEAARSPQDVAEDRPGTRYEYGVGGTLLEAITNSEGERIEYEYQAGRRILHVTQIGEGNPRHRFEFFGKDTALARWPTVHINPLGGQTRYLYDNLARLREVELVDTGEITSLAYTTATAPGLVRPSSITTPDGATILMTVDESDDVVEIVTPSGNVITKTYDPAALNFEDPTARAVLRVDDSLGPVEERLYDAQGRVTTILNGEGEATSFTYGPYAVDSETLPSGRRYEYTLYGVHGHWLRMNTPEVTDHRAFDLVGNALVESAVRDRGGLLARSYNDDRELSSLDVAATDENAGIAEIGTIEMARRSDGQIVSITRPGGGDHEFVFDAIGRVVEERERVDGAWSVTTFSYDLAGNLASRSRPNGMREEMGYDSYGRPVARRAFRDDQLEGELLLTYANGQISATHDSIRGLSETYSYDSAGRLQTTLFGFGETLSREYDLRSRLTREVFNIPRNGVVADIGYRYDLAGRKVEIIDQVAGEVLVDQLFVGGRLEETLFGNGLRRRRIYDAEKKRLVGMITKNASQEVVERTEISYTFETNPVRNQLRTRTATALATTEEAYWIAPGGTLARPEDFVGKRVFGWSDGSRIERFAYDELGNRVSDTSGDAFTYNAERNRLVSADLAAGAGPINYTYDEAGFVTERAGVPITWTALGRIASLGADSFEWDMTGRLISMTVGGVERDFELFGGRVEGDAAQGMLGMLDLGEVALQLGTGEHLYRHLDFRGNVSFVSDDLGDVVAQHRYSPYGLDASFGAGEDTATFVGRSQIGELMILGFRIYDPGIGRFLSPDPILQLVNQFSYTLGNPVWYSDPDGRDGAEVVVAVGATVSLGIAIAVLILTGPISGGLAALLVGAGIGIDFALVGWTWSQVLLHCHGGAGMGAPMADVASCSPTTLRGVSNLGGMLFVLILVQLLLGLAIVGKGRRHAAANRVG